MSLSNEALQKVSQVFHHLPESTTDIPSARARNWNPSCRGTAANQCGQESNFWKATRDQITPVDNQRVDYSSPRYQCLRRSRQDVRKATLAKSHDYWSGVSIGLCTVPFPSWKRGWTKIRLIWRRMWKICGGNFTIWRRRIRIVRITSIRSSSLEDSVHEMSYQLLIWLWR